MKLTLLTDYALRTLIHVGTKEGELSTIGEIAATFDISRTHLMKVVHKLGQCGYLDTIRGKNGGIRLRGRPEEIGIGAVVRAIEQDLAVIGCMSEEGFCRIQGCCVLQGALRAATHAFLDALDAYTLADLLAPRVRLAQALGPPHPAHSGLSGR